DPPPPVNPPGFLGSIEAWIPPVEPPAPDPAQISLRASLTAPGRVSFAPDQVATFALSLPPPPAAVSGRSQAGLRLIIPSGAPDVDIHATVDSEHFRPVDAGSWARWFKIGRSDATPASWEIPARAVGDRQSYTLTVTFAARDGSFLGEVEATLTRYGG